MLLACTQSVDYFIPSIDGVIMLLRDYDSEDGGSQTVPVVIMFVTIISQIAAYELGWAHNNI